MDSPDSPAAGNERNFDAVHRELRALARAHTANERAGHTLQATALVHEVWANLAAADGQRWTSPRVFASLAAESMRRILIDPARGRAAAKRGGATESASAKRSLLAIDDVADLAAAPEPEAIEQFDDLLMRLESEDATAAEVVRLRFYAGLSIEETAEAMGSSASTVEREWQFAREWLAREVGRESS